MTSKIETTNELRDDKVLRLVIKYSIPAILAMMVTSLYNTVDRAFIGSMKDVGALAISGFGVTMPFTTILGAFCVGLAVGGSTNIAIKLGEGNKEEAEKALGNTFAIELFVGIAMMIISAFFLEDILYFFGASSDTIKYSMDYMSVIMCGAWFNLPGFAMNSAIRGEGNPKLASKMMITSCLLNLILDPIFIFIFNMGMTGAALATITGQIISFCISLRYMFHFKNIKLSGDSFNIKWCYCKNILILGASACFNQIAMTIVQIVMNNTLSRYGAQSIYGGDIPLACAGIITKVNMIFMSFVIGISQGTQPVIGFNYGARKYKRVKKTYLLALGAASFLSLIAFFCFQVFPRQIISVFGNGSELYFQFSERYFRIYMFLTLINGIQPVTSNFFNSIGKSSLGVLLSLTRQILFLLPLIVIFPIFMGIDGVMYAGPIADAAAAIVCGYFTIRELKELTAKDKASNYLTKKITYN